MKNKFLTFCCACVPGAGQMYYGYMKRGLTLVSIFCAATMVSSILSPILVVLPVVWMFSFFDTYDLIHRAAMGCPREDDLLGELLDAASLSQLRLPGVHRMVGWGLIGMGVWVLYDVFVRPLVAAVLGWMWADRNLPSLVVAALLIVGGLYLLGFFEGGRHKRTLPPQKEQ